jgi:hypothetical protein
MAVAWFRNPVLDHMAPIIDRDSVNERTFGVSTTRRHPAYVYAINKNAHLMHRIAGVTIHWYAIVTMNKLGRLKQPAMIAKTMCGYHFPLTADRTRTCTVPEPDAVLCGRCHGEPATFGKHGRGTKEGWDKRAARVKLGCEVAGYPSALARYGDNRPLGDFEGRGEDGTVDR